MVSAEPEDRHTEPTTHLRHLGTASQFGGFWADGFD